MIGHTLAHYRITAALGAGGMGEVYRATDLKLGRDVALKVLPVEMAGDGERLARFQREARAVAALNHPHIVTLYSVEESDGLHFLTMELVEGQSLDRLIPREGLPVERLLSIAGDVAEALDAAHAKGIVHRDLKPANVMVTHDGRVKVLDFGLAKDLRPADPADATVTSGGQTAMGVVMGTPAYMSPEQITGKAVDQRTDLFALGILLYEMACGRRPFAGATSMELASAILRDTPRPVADIRAALPRSIDAVIGGCLTKEPARRTRTARDVRAALRAIARELEAAAATPAAARASSDDGSAGTSGAVRADEGFWVAVLPFKHRGTDPGLEALAEGLVEDIVTGLSRFSYLRVISQSSTARVTGESGDVRALGRSLGARYLMEGSFRQAGSALRVAVQLVDASSGAHLWAETYDRTFTAGSVFEVQDDLVPRIVSTVADTYGVLPHTMSESLRGRSADELSPYEAVLRSFGYHERITAEEHLLVREILERAVEHAPASADGWANLSFLYAEEYKHAFNERPDALDRALDAARRAVAAAPSNHLAYHALAQALFFRRELAAFRNAADRVVALNPMDGGSVAFMGILISYAGDWDRGCALAERAMQLNPHHPGWYRFASFNNAYRQGDDRAALDIALKFNMPSYFYTHVAQAVACAQLGERDAARRALGELLAQKPDFAAVARHELEKWNYAVPDLVERYLDGLRKAGLDLHDGGAGPEPRPVPGALAGVGAPAGDPPQASIAVLPFASLSADRDDEFLADGISEEIINALVQIPDLKVAARTSAFTFKGNTDDLRVVGEKLGVRTVLQGSVRRAGSRLRITVQLVGVDDGYHLWSERYDRDMADVFAVQDEIASNIAARLELTLGGGGRGVPRGASEALGTSNVEAYELYLKGRHLWYQRTPVSLSGAVDYFSQAIRLDPGFASAHAGLSDALSIQRATGNVPYASTYPMAAAAARRAAELMPDAVEVQIALAYHESYYGDDWTRAEAHWRRALELDPRSPLAHGQYALFLAAHGRRDEAHHHAAKGREHDPLSPFLAALEGMGRFILGEFDAAVASCAAALELQGNFPLALIMRGLSLSRLGRHGEAIDELETAAEATRRGVMFVGALGQAYGRAGNREAAVRIIEELERRSSEGEYVSPFGLLHVHLGLGDRDGLERALRACLDDRMPPITICVAGADALRALATEPTLDDLLGRLRLPR